MTVALVYRGWIPTVAGKLSFRIIGDCNHPTRCVSANSLVGSHRYVLSFQRRNLSDAPFRKIAALRNLVGDFRFVFIGRVRQDLNAINLPMFGHVFLFKDLRVWRRIRHDARYAQNLLNRYQENPDEQHALEPSVIQAMTGVSARLEAAADVSCRIVLKRTGELSLRRLTPKRPEYIELADDLRIYANLSLSEMMAAQFYYFMRDITHAHQHHHPRTDTILTVYATRNDVDWRKNVLFSLYNHIISRKRSSSFFECGNSLGILAYAESFYRLCKGSLGARWPHHEKNFPTFNNEELKASIGATLERLRSSYSAAATRRQERWQHKITWFTVLVSLMALLFAFGGGNPIENERMACYAKEARANIFLSLPLFLAPYFFYLFVSSAIDVRSWRSIRGIARLLLALPEWVSVTLLLVFSLILVPATWYQINSTAEPAFVQQVMGSLSQFITDIIACPR